MRGRFIMMSLLLGGVAGLQAQSVELYPKSELPESGDISADSTVNPLMELPLLERLEVPSEQNGVVLIDQIGEAKEVIDIVNAQPKGESVRGYRVGLFFDNGQHARSGATKVREEFAQLYPDIEVHVTYENPYFKVAAGDCISQEEAVMLLERVRHNFPKAFIQRDNIFIDEL